MKKLDLKLTQSQENELREAIKEYRPVLWEFTYESRIEKDLIEDMGDDSIAWSWVHPSKNYAADNGSWAHDEEIDQKRWDTAEYNKITQQGTRYEFDHYWNEKMRQKRDGIISGDK